MHIAIVADNVADRKHAERLFGRANTALSDQVGTLFVDSYGDEASFLHACMKYDMFLIDFDHDIPHSLSVAQRIKELNAPGLITICKHETEPWEYEPYFSDVFLLDKPIHADRLHQLIRDISQELEQIKSRLDLFEIRTETETHYVSSATILYARFTPQPEHITYHMETGEIYECRGSLVNLQQQFADYPEFAARPGHLYVNTAHIHSESKKGIVFSTGEELKYSLMQRLFHNNNEET